MLSNNVYNDNATAFDNANVNAKKYPNEDTLTQTEKIGFAEIFRQVQHVPQNNKRT